MKDATGVARSGRQWLDGIDDPIRRQLVSLVRRPQSRNATFNRMRPKKWQPAQVRNPNGILDADFTDSTAWEFIASRLESGEPVEVIKLDKPQGQNGYVMKIDIGSDMPRLYVKLELSGSKVFGRSFHYSE